MPNTTILPQGLENETDDAPKKFRNIDTEDFACMWGGIEHVVKPGEVVIKPKYLVNFLAMHLARKMYKRKIFEGKTELERSVGILRYVNAEEEMKLQTQMVADNFEQTPEESKPELIPELEPTSTIPKEEKKEEEKKPEEVSYKCDVCGFIAKNNIGLSAHKRFKHK